MPKGIFYFALFDKQSIEMESVWVPKEKCCPAVL